MAQHEISVQVRETFWLSGKNLRIGVESDGEVLGEIRISKSSLDWIPKGSKTAQPSHLVGRFRQAHGEADAPPAWV